MKTRIDAIKCQGYGTCVDRCPELFELDEWGFAAVIGDGDVPEVLEEAARSAQAACPEDAVHLAT
jgi:ferredoxin